MTSTRSSSAARSITKRVFDVVVAFFMLVALSPILAVIVGMVWARMGRPALFTQLRPGYLGRPFHMFKFRSMCNAIDASGQPLPDEQRLTAFGKLLRSTSLDELPEFWNVLRGEMSLVGPRPLRMEYLDRYTPEQMRRHDVRPGITGWAQVKGRNAITWEKKFELDVWYVDNWSLALDCKILWQTVATVIFRRGISSSEHATMPEFTGSPSTTANATGTE